MNIMDKLNNIDIHAIYNYLISFFISVLLFLIFFYIFSFIATRFIKAIFNRVSKKGASIHLLKSLLMFLSHMLIIISLLSIFFDITTSSILLFFSTIGISFSIALKNEISNFASGISIILSNKIEIGKDITVIIGSSKYRGIVHEVSILHTTLLVNNIKTVFSNNLISENVVEMNS